MSDKETETYGVLSPVRHNNKRYATGSPIELDEDGHAELFKLGCVSEEPIEPVDDAVSDEQKLAPDTLENVIAGIEGMDPDEDFKKDGDPRADALDKVFTDRPTDDMVEQAMTEIKNKAAS